MSYIALAFGVGVAAGLRSLSPPAVVAWAAYLGWLNLSDSALRFMASTIAVVMFSLLAVFELIPDLLPQTGKRTAPVPLAPPFFMGGRCAACFYAASTHPLVIGAILAPAAGLTGAFTVYKTGRRLIAPFHLKAIFVACSKTWSPSDSPVSSFHANSRRQSGD